MNNQNDSNIESIQILNLESELTAAVLFFEVILLKNDKDFACLAWFGAGCKSAWELRWVLVADSLISSFLSFDQKEKEKSGTNLKIIIIFMVINTCFSSI